MEMLVSIRTSVSFASEYYALESAIEEKIKFATPAGWFCRRTVARGTRRPDGRRQRTHSVWR